MNHDYQRHRKSLPSRTLRRTGRGYERDCERRLYRRQYAFSHVYCHLAGTNRKVHSIDMLRYLAMFVMHNLKTLKKNYI